MPKRIIKPCPFLLLLPPLLETKSLPVDFQAVQCRIFRNKRSVLGNTLKINLVSCLFGKLWAGAAGLAQRQRVE